MVSTSLQSDEVGVHWASSNREVNYDILSTAVSALCLTAGVPAIRDPRLNAFRSEVTLGRALIFEWFPVLDGLTCRDGFKSGESVISRPRARQLVHWHKGRCYDIELISGAETQYIGYVAYPLDLFEEGSVTNILTSVVGNVFGFKALRALRLEDLRMPSALLKTFFGAPHGIQVERDRLNKYGRALLGCTIKPKLGLSAKNYGRAVYE